MNNKQWAVILHLSGFAGIFLPTIGNWAAPLIIWLLMRSENAEIDRVGKEVINFQISYTLYTYVLGVIVAALMWILIGFLLVPLFGLLWMLWAILMILGAIKASNGCFYTYPLILRLL